MIIVLTYTLNVLYWFDVLYYFERFFNSFLENKRLKFLFSLEEHVTIAVHLNRQIML